MSSKTKIRNGELNDITTKQQKTNFYRLLTQLRVTPINFEEKNREKVSVIQIRNWEETERDTEQERDRQKQRQRVYVCVKHFWS